VHSFQATIGKTHDFKIDGVKGIVKVLSASGWKVHEVYHYYVVPPDRLAHYLNCKLDKAHASGIKVVEKVLCFDPINPSNT
jgi:hypothetical protein